MSKIVSAPVSISGVICKVSNLTVAYHSGGEWLQAVRDVSFEVLAGEILAIVG